MILSCTVQVLLLAAFMIYGLLSDILFPIQGSNSLESSINQFYK